MPTHFRFWGAVAKDGSHIRAVAAAQNKEMAEDLLMAGWTPALKALYEVRPVQVTVDPRAELPADTGRAAAGGLA